MPLPDDEQAHGRRCGRDRIPTLIDAPLNAEETRQTKPSAADNKSRRSRLTRCSRKKAKKNGGSIPERLEEHRKLLRDFERGLAKVRRVLANIPTYMIFDDHDVTDDWNLNPLWYDRVLDHAARRQRSCAMRWWPTRCSRTGATTR